MGEQMKGMERWIDGQMNTWMDRQADACTERQIDRQRNGRERQAGGQRNRDR